MPSSLENPQKSFVITEREFRTMREAISEIAEQRLRLNHQLHETVVEGVRLREASRKLEELYELLSDVVVAVNNRKKGDEFTVKALGEKV